MRLGCGPGSGYGTHGLDDAARHELRGCRVFTLDERRPGEFRTRNIYAKDLGIDVKDAGDQPIDKPAPLPL